MANKNEERINEFKDFVRQHPGLRDEVGSGRSTWQKLYQEWYLYGPEDGVWANFKPGTTDSNFNRNYSNADQVNSNMRRSSNDTRNELSGPEMIAQAFDYLQKVDIDKVQKTMGTFQQFIQLFQSMQNTQSGKAAANAGILGKPATTKQNYSGFFSQFDD